VQLDPVETSLHGTACGVDVIRDHTWQLGGLESTGFLEGLYTLLGVDLSGGRDSAGATGDWSVIDWWLMRPACMSCARIGLPARAPGRQRASIRRPARRCADAGMHAAPTDRAGLRAVADDEPSPSPMRVVFGRELSGSFTIAGAVRVSGAITRQWASSGLPSWYGEKRSVTVTAPVGLLGQPAAGESLPQTPCEHVAPVLD